MLGFDEKLGLKNQIYFTHRSNRSNNIRRDYSDGICSQSKYSSYQNEKQTILEIINRAFVRSISDRRILKKLNKTIAILTKLKIVSQIGRLYAFGSRYSVAAARTSSILYALATNTEDTTEE